MGECRLHASHGRPAALAAVGCRAVPGRPRSVSKRLIIFSMERSEWSMIVTFFTFVFLPRIHFARSSQLVQYFGEPA